LCIENGYIPKEKWYKEPHLPSFPSTLATLCK
jgi:hypothetical protein